MLQGIPVTNKKEWYVSKANPGGETTMESVMRLSVCLSVCLVCSVVARPRRRLLEENQFGERGIRCDAIRCDAQQQQQEQQQNARKRERERERASVERASW